MSKRPKIMLAVRKGALVPADKWSEEALRDRNYSIGDVLAAELTKPRNPRFNNYVHAFAKLLKENLEPFEHMPPHKILKRLQIEGDIACDEILLVMPGIGPCGYRQARSLAFDSMDEAEFSEVYRAFCTHVAKQYWPDLTADQIAEMAEMMGQVA